MRRTLAVAGREFVATVATRGFILGMLVTPALLALVIFALPRLLKEEAPRVEGEVAVLDPTGAVASRLAAELAPEVLARQRAEIAAEVEEQIPAGLAVGPAADSGRLALAAALGEVPVLSVTALPAGASLEAAKAPLWTRAERGRLALLAVHPDAVRPAGEGDPLGSYDFFVREKLDDRVQDAIRGAVARVLVDARLEAAGLDRRRVEVLTEVPRVRSVTVTATGETATNEIASAFLPAGFVALLLISVMMGGQQLMTSTVEEKASRVVEVLLSAVSPLELMAGKILGQMAVGFLILALYAGLGISVLVTFALLGLLDPVLLPLLVLLYLIAYFTLGSLMAAIGAAVNELREAQALLAPVTVAVMVPWVLWLPLSRDPNSAFATALSFLPPVSCFVLLLRLASSAPPPAWQVALSIFVGLAGAWAAVWFAAKVFRVGLLLHGKPPSFGTLVTWVRRA